ncbi:hypothetical protein CPB86DRAFT_431862 [Serendipita vermifera]|nr:hypothetical protein CPB86DRAFT_431862 [Serendipita vermifera]
MSSHSSSRLPVYSPPFTPVRSTTKKSSSSSSPSTMLLTPGATPLNPQNRNRFDTLASPDPSKGPSRAPLKAKSQNIDHSTAGSDANWRVPRKPNTPKTPAGSSTNNLLPTPFHSTQRRGKFAQNQNQNAPSISPAPVKAPLKTPIRTKKNIFPLTPEDSPFTALTSKLAPLTITTPPKTLDTPPLSPSTPESPIRTLPKLNSNVTKGHSATCAACNRILSSAALLSPCNHLVCSPCFTGCLNAAGEKGMDCMACKMPILSFQLTSAVISASGSALPVPETLAASVAAAAQQAKEAAFIPTSKSDAQIRPINNLGSSSDGGEASVLRIDNVPWDVTPEMLAEWIGNETPSLFNHAMIDRRDGRTLSYAFIEVSANAMKAILRARQNTILGNGRRARAVTITVSTQDELMREMFPSWKGHFLGCKPCVAGMDNAQISSALREGLMSTKDVEDILKLLRKPDSHFVKVPTLPYHYFISILRKLPTDKDSKILLTVDLKESLFNMVQAAMEELQARTSDDMFNKALEALKACVADCQVFSVKQKSELLQGKVEVRLKDLEQCLVESPIDVESNSPKNGKIPDSVTKTMTPDLLDLLATTHNVSTQTIQALAQDLLQRLTAANSQMESPFDTIPLGDTLTLPAAEFSSQL